MIVNKNGAKRIITYTYKGSDASLYYKYMISPIAQYIVNHYIPPWIAPNTITIFGLFLVLTSHIILAIYSINMDNIDIPMWVHIWSGLSLFMYQILDVADGKQARKTNNASPLGLLFDHGCDAFNLILSSCNISATLLMGSTYKSILLLLCPAIVFFMATWEEYYTGILALPIINGPNEGLCIMYIIYFITAIFGSNYWNYSSFIISSMSNGSLFLFATVIATIIQVILNVSNVIQTLRKKTQNIKEAIIGLVPFLLLVILPTIWIIQNSLYKNKNENILTYHSRLFLWSFGLLFCKMVMHMMIAHLCEERIFLLRKTVLFIIVVITAVLIGIISNVNEIHMVPIMFIVCAMAYAHMVYYVIQDLTKILNIKVFHVKKIK